MGLAGEKKRVKLSFDPNNTRWTNDPDSFGHKMMTAQGWQPGQFLGAKDAKHAEFHTAANASHIRVAIKDDNLGLGAKVGSGVGHGECTGLDVFKNILGRLNGKDELEIEKEQQSRDDLKRAIYTERKWGSIRFVQGGFLIGDRIQHLIDGEAERIRKLADGSSSDSEMSGSSSGSEAEDLEAVATIKKSKKRKADVLAEPVAEVVAVKIKRSEKSKKSEAIPVEEVTAILQEVKLPKKSKNDRRRPKGMGPIEETAEDLAAAQRKREKKERKRQREERRKEKAGRSDVEDDTKTLKKSKREKKKAEKEKKQSSESSPSSTKESAPSVPLTAPSSGRSTPLMQGRHAVRSRNIAQKRLAAMDATALNQIFMIKS